MQATARRRPRPSFDVRQTALDKARSTGIVARLMASEMVDHVAASGSCSEEDLRRYGFTSIEIAEFGPTARQEAERMSTRDAIAA